MEIAPGLYQLKVPMPGPLEYVLAYLFRSEDGYILVDPGWDSAEAFAALERQLSDIDVRVSDIRCLIITHIHHDHYGLVARVKEASAAQVLLHERDWASIRPYIDDIEGTIHEMKNFLAMQGVPQQEISAVPIPGEAMRNILLKAQPDRTVRGGEIIEGDSLRWEVIWTPGHSSGHICLYERSQQLLLTGDHVLPVITPHVSFNGRPGSNPLGDFLESLRALKSLKVRRALPAHEFAFDDLHGRIQEIEEHHQARLQEIMDTLSQEPLTAYEVAHHVTWVTGDFRDFDFGMQGAAVRETLAHLEYALLDGRLTKGLEDGVYRYRLS